MSATSEAVRHGEKSLRATLRPTLEERLSPAETLALTVAALPADQVALPWFLARGPGPSRIRPRCRTRLRAARACRGSCGLVAQARREYGHDAEPGYPDPWMNLYRHLFSLRLWQATSVIDTRKQPLVARMHRLLQEMMTLDAGEHADVLERVLLDHIRARAKFLWHGWVHPRTPAGRWPRWQPSPSTGLSAMATMPRCWPGWRLDRWGSLGQFAATERLTRRELAIDERLYGRK